MGGFINEYVTRMRVMDWEGNIHIIDDEAELRHWRCSFGLLGIILGVEFRLEHRTRLEMYSVKRTLEKWDEKEFWKFIMDDAEADIASSNVPLDETSKSNLHSTRKSWNGEFFVDFLNSGLDGTTPTMFSYSQKKNEHASDVPENRMPNIIEANYQSILDGFFLTRSPAALAAAFFVNPDKAFDAMNKVKEHTWNSRHSKQFTWNLPGEFRFIHVADKATLQPMEPGLWFNAQMISFSDLAENDQAWRKEFKAVEDYWVQELGARPHMGKLWGMEESANGDIEPFANSYACTIYSQATKDAFNAYREKWDPHGLFFTGLGQKLLSPCP